MRGAHMAHIANPRNRFPLQTLVTDSVTDFVTPSCCTPFGTSVIGRVRVCQLGWVFFWAGGHRLCGLGCCHYPTTRGRSVGCSCNPGFVIEMIGWMLCSGGDSWNPLAF
jgi:hypothetical protein